MTRLVALYPRAWRDRYEDEFLSLLADRGLDGRDRLDIVRGALDARLHPQAAGSHAAPEAAEHGPRWSVRAGWLTLAGLPLWIGATIVWMTGPLVIDEGESYRDGTAAMPLFWLALVMLGVGIAAVGSSLPTRARAGRAGAYVACLIGLIWSFAPWEMWYGLVAAAGLAMMGVSARRVGSWRGTDAALLVAGQASAWLVVSVVFAAPVRLPEFVVAFVVLLTTAWIAVGHALVRPAPREVLALGD